jgi:hypothetical protein
LPVLLPLVPEVLLPDASWSPGSKSGGTELVEQAKAKIATLSDQGRTRIHEM